MKGNTTIVFAGGGSGGHISPGLAIAERIAEVSPETRSLFLCSTRTIDSTMLTEAQAEFIAIPATPPSIHPLRAWRFVRNFSICKRVALQAFSVRTVSKVIAMGGFVAAPVVSAARSRRIPVTLINLDNPPGKANRWIAKRANDVLTAAPIPSQPDFATQIVGLPVRKRAISPGDPEFCKESLGLDPSLPVLLVTGASQGATSLNNLMVQLCRANPTMFDDWQILHLTGLGAEEEIRYTYRESNVNACVKPFLHEIGQAWGAADLAISRAGANSVAEVAINAVPTIFLPYPHHKDRHQWNNARPLVDLGGAVICDDLLDATQNAATVGSVLMELMTDDSRRTAMRNKLLENKPPDAADVIARHILGNE